MNDTKRAAIFERLREANPAPTTELEHMTPFELLVAVVLSAQSTDKGVNKATAKLFPVANTPTAIAKLGVDGLTPYIASLGLFRNKAKAVVGLSEILMREHGGEVPRDRAALEALPGVGRKTANVVLNSAFGEPVIAVDTHIFRVANRTGLAPGKDVVEVERKLEKTTPDAFNSTRPLADPAGRPCIARAEMRRLRDPRPVRVQAKRAPNRRREHPFADRARADVATPRSKAASRWRGTAGAKRGRGR
jgi:endonuclease-3